MKNSYAVTTAIAAVLTTTVLVCPFCGGRDAGDIPGKGALETQGGKVSEKEDVRKPAHKKREKREGEEQKPKNLHDRLKDLDKAIRESPRDSELYVERGMVRYLLGDYRGAEADYDAAIALNPKLADAYVRRGEAKNALKEYVGAIDDFNEALRLKPRSAEAYFGRGYAKHMLER